jgi:hypothetical protein
LPESAKLQLDASIQFPYTSHHLAASLIISFHNTRCGIKREVMLMPIADRMVKMVEGMKMVKQMFEEGARLKVFFGKPGCPAATTI